MKTAFLLITSAWLAGADPVVEPLAEPLAAPKTAQAPAAPAPTGPVVSTVISDATPEYVEHAGKVGFFARLKEKLTYKPKHHVEKGCSCGQGGPVLSPPPALPVPATPEKMGAPEKLPNPEKEKTETPPESKEAPVQTEKEVPF